MPAGKINYPAATVPSSYPFCHFPCFIELFSWKCSCAADRPGNFIKKVCTGKQWLLLWCKPVFWRPLHDLSSSWISGFWQATVELRYKNMPLEDVGNTVVSNIPESKPFPLLSGIAWIVRGSVKTDENSSKKIWSGFGTAVNVDLIFPFTLFKKE